MLKVSEIFTSIQGEGVDVGRVAAFVRFSGCPLGCRFCDTEYAKREGKEISIAELISKLKKFQIPDIVVTGGEPLVQENIASFLTTLSKELWVRKIFIETCGFVFKEEIFAGKVFLNLSPKPPSMIGTDYSRFLLQYIRFFPERVNVKFLIADKTDLSYALKIVKSEPEFFKIKGLVFQPVEIPGKPYPDAVKQVLSLIFKNRSILSQFEVKVIPQVHKLLGIK
ncbi:7-carboxy-7-deazaguanine synthase QueE [Desulfurobacterium atlanticum]|uniref:7-carboxy-7-deazaguanine synthase n=1 Tax=Desulfurobacterium atlanticum TaxID=240169 RepID=A0A238XJ36_9BACT|nr:7-carboxy-7-deazaguanine synthase QueE [Desulfurobacterium atlanticum]SNR58730.1 7-carboxy-7-deazaguanine synthase [Desulfurobacterium atlanticum]